MRAASPMARPAAWFIAVGVLAAGVHLAVVVALVARVGLAPLMANVIGWGVAFIVSFSGHFHLSFRGSGAPVRRAAARFFTISAAGFTVNELTYASALHFGGLRYDITLGIVLVSVAVLTFVASRHWAFIGKPGSP